jgi:integrase
MLARRIGGIECEANTTADGAALGGAVVDSGDGVGKLRRAERCAASKRAVASELKPRNLHRPIRALENAERSRVLAEMTKLPKDQALFALTLAWTGARVSEVLALTAASFQIESGIVAIQTLKRRRHIVREVPIRRS